MTPFVSVKFSAIGRPQSFIHTGIELVPGDECIVQSDRGAAIGTVVPSLPALDGRRSPPADSARRVTRKATEADVVTRFKHQQRERDAYRFCLMKVRERGIEMKLSRVEQLFDGTRLVFYFTAPGRVDFRELVKDLAHEFRTRIELRQIGPRDEARMLGGYGSCGRPLCCTTWLTQFEPISIKMAKQQGLNPNPSRLSGLCGRLKCCLRFETPNAQGVKGGGCGHEGGCTNGGCGTGECSTGSCGNGGCQHHKEQ